MRSFFISGRREHTSSLCPCSAGVARSRCATMRLLPAGADHERSRATEDQEKPERRRHRRDREHMPLRDLRPHPPGDQECGGCYAIALSIVGLQPLWHTYQVVAEGVEAGVPGGGPTWASSP